MSICSLMSNSVHNAHRAVKAKRTPEVVHIAQMIDDSEIDDRPDEAKRLSKARELRGFSDAKAAAEFFGWKYSTYSQHERGERGLRRPVAERYAKAFRVSPAWLLTGERPEGMQDIALAHPVGPTRGSSPEDSRQMTDLEQIAFAAVEEAFLQAGFPSDIAGKTAAAIQRVIVAHPDAQPGLSRADMARILVRYELERILPLNS